MILFTHPLDRGLWNDGPAFDDWLTPEAAPPIARRHLCRGFGGGKGGTTTQSSSASVGPPQEVINRLNEVWGRATTAANQPFQTYGGEFTAPINAQQNAGISAINNAAGLYAPYGSDATSALTAGAAGALPYYGTATDNLNQGLGAGQNLTNQALGTLSGAYSGVQPYNNASANYTLAGAGAANPTTLDQATIDRYMSPYLNDVVSSTLKNMQQQQQGEQSTVGGNAIQSGAFGGDRGGVAAANLARQQDLATGQTVGGLLNTGYNNALGVAQQQQGLGLSAQQANLARLAAAGTQLGTLGNTIYGQGANTAYQQGNLGNQLFNQGLGASQQQQALGQSYFGLGQGLSQGLANLGTTAQTNALNVGREQIGAGTLQQQTSQAQDTALYNQFLQQMGYPFQTAQFLSNIAQGTAPLYGTTTNSYGSSTQPASFFKRGGRVDDLQMDDNGEWRVKRASGGLSGADDLAQLIAAQGQMYLPRAAGVGASGAGGPYGLGLSAGPSAQLIQAHVTPMQIQRHEGGLGKSLQSINQAVDFGTNAGKVYREGKEAIVGAPARTDPKGNVIPATSGWYGHGGKWGASAPSTSSTSSSTAPQLVYLDQNGNLVGGLSAPASTATYDDLPPVYNRGGRAGLSYGGMPYATRDQIVPEDISDPLSVTQPLKYAEGLGGESRSGGQSTMGKIGQTASTLGSIAKLGSMVLPFFLNTGGRVGKEGGGGLSDPVALVPSDDDLFPKLLVAESRGQHFKPTGEVLTSPKGATGIAQVMPATAPEAAKLAGVEWNPELFGRSRTGDPARDKEAEDYNRKLGQAYYNEQKRTFGDPHVAAAAYNAGPGAVRAAQQKAAVNGGSYLDYLPKETQGYVSSLMPQRGTVSLHDPGLGAVPDPAAVVPPVAASASAPDKESWWSKDSGGLSGTERAVISLLSGLGGMASSPSRFLGSAVLQGLGAGAGTYGQLAQKGREIDISQQQANTAQGQLGIAQTAKNIEVYNILRIQAGAYIRAGQPVPEQLKAQLAQLAASLPTGVVAGQPAVPRQAQSQAAQVPPGQGVPAPTDRTPIIAKALPATAPAKTEPQPEEKSGEPKPSIADPAFRSRLGRDRDPAVMRERANELAAIGDSQGAKDLMAQAQATEDRMIATGKAVDKDGNVIDVPGWAQQQASVGRVEPNQKWLDEQGTQALQRAQAREQLDVIKGVLETYESGSLSGRKAQAQALAKSLGIHIPDTATMSAAEYEKFLKATLRNVFSDVRDMGGRPLVSEIQGFEKATASPELQPEANKEILAQLYARLNQLDKYYGDTATEMTKNKALDRGAYTGNWLKQKENSLVPMVEEVKRDLAVRGATPSDIKSLKEGHAYIVEPGQFPGVTERGKYRMGRNAQGQIGLIREGAAPPVAPPEGAPRPQGTLKTPTPPGPRLASDAAFNLVPPANEPAKPPSLRTTPTPIVRSRKPETVD